MLLLPVLGILYSAPPLRLRRFPIPGILIICTGLVTPLTLGMLEKMPPTDVWPVTAGVFIFCLATVPLKSTEETEEARRTGRPNLYLRQGRKLFFYSAAGLLIGAAWALWMMTGAMRVYLLLLCALSLPLLAFHALKANPAGLYRSIIRLVILLGLGLAFISI